MWRASSLPLTLDSMDGCPHKWDIKTTNTYSTDGNFGGHWQAANGGATGKNRFGGDIDSARQKKDNVTLSGFCQLCGAWRGSLGLEPTFELYISHLIQIFDEVKRVLRKDGTCWVNLGDSYSGSGKDIGTDRTKGKESYTDDDINKTDWKATGVQPKSLCQIPSRFAIAMTDAGWILRNELIWYKRNCMPSSAKDRFTVDFEKMFFFTKNNKYWFEQQKEPIKMISVERSRRGNNENKYSKDDHFPDGVHANTMSQPRDFKGYDGVQNEFDNHQGRNKRCVNLVDTQYMRLKKDLTFATKQHILQEMLKRGLV